MPQATVDSAAVFLVLLFLPNPRLTRSHAEEIRRTLGPYPASAATKVCATAKNLVLLLPSDQMAGNRGGSGESSSRETGSASSSSVVREEFAVHVAFKFDSRLSVGGSLDVSGSQHGTKEKGLTAKKSSSLQSHKPPDGYDSLSDSDHEDTSARSITDAFLIGIELQSSDLLLKDREVKGQTSARPEAGDGGGVLEHSGGWLRQQLQALTRSDGLSGVAWDELFSAVFELLSSARDNGSIENDVRVCLCLYPLAIGFCIVAMI